MKTEQAKPRCAIVLCHPRSDSFCASVAARVEEVVRSAGYESFLRDLYSMRFDPVLHARDIAVHEGGRSLSPDVEMEVSLLGNPQIMILVYPIWFGSPPAVLKGYIERVLGAGFAGPGTVPTPAGPSPELLVTIATSGAKAEWIEKRGIAASAGRVFGAYLSAALAIPHAEHIAVDNVIPTMSLKRGSDALDKVERTLRELLSKECEAEPAESAWPAASGTTAEGQPDEPLLATQLEG